MPVCSGQALACSMKTIMLQSFLFVAFALRCNIAFGHRQPAHETGVDTCMTRALRRAESQPNDIQAHARAMAKEGLDEKLLQDMDFGTADMALQSAGIRVWASRRRIFKCFSTAEQRKSGKTCALNVCQNGGVCVVDLHSASHVCQCGIDYRGKFCQRNISGREAVEELYDRVSYLQGAVGTIYNRWGHHQCPKTASLVYHGSAAGSPHNKPGSGANLLCLPSVPKYMNVSKSSSGAIIAGTEYEGVNALANGRTISDRNVPCAVCYAKQRGTTLMLPATDVCPYGWTEEYHGFLMSTHVTQTKSEFVCVDRALETLQGFKASTNGALLYSVAVDCSLGLDCPPYKASQALICAVCTK